MMKGETVLSGAEHPGTKLEAMKSAAGWYLGYKDEDGMPYSRETDYFEHKAQALAILTVLRA